MVDARYRTQCDKFDEKIPEPLRDDPGRERRCSMLNDAAAKSSTAAC
jgi:hypothetical protein